MRKAKKYLEYSEIEEIPGKLQAERLAMPDSKALEKAWLALAEFLLKWMLALPWRERNICECRIGGSKPNIFKAKIPSQIPMDVPAWIRAEAQTNSEATFWQMHFAPKETKPNREIRAFVPRPLIKLLEDYLRSVRPSLVKGTDPGTLFVSKEGRAMTKGQVYNLVRSRTAKYGGRGVNPHLFRDIVAFAWLKAHPHDYLSLSKILWHANVNVTLKTYGSRFDESSGVCAMEIWLEERAAATARK
jgi:integrase